MKKTKHHTFWVLSMAVALMLGVASCNQAAEKKENQSATKYQEEYRSQFHFTPDSMWMNDPNGMVYYDGEYHLFYQHNPDTNVWAPMHWGHAVSTDLVHWEHLPIGLYPDSLGMIFSGSAVMDHQNTSGFGTRENPPMIAIYTYHDMDAANAGVVEHQTQAIAYSLDKGRTWTKYEGNPVVENPGIKDFRDPKVFWHQDSEKWVMILAAQDRVMLYGSADLKEWEYLSEFGENEGAHGGVWECPDLFALDIEGEDTQKWVMLLSINPGGPNGGSATQYFVGDFDGTEFTWDEEEIKWIDWGKDNYAGVTWSDIPEEDGRRIFIGWMSNWEYARVVPTYHWRNAMTLPRKLSLQKHDEAYTLVSEPVEELKKLRTGDPLTKDNVLVKDQEELFSNISMLSEVKIEFTKQKNTQFGNPKEFGLQFSNDKGDKLSIGYQPNKERLFIDRSESGKIGFHEAFDDTQFAPLAYEKNLKLHLFIDKASAEVFVNDGQRVLTSIMFPTKDYDKITAFSKDGSVYIKSVEVFELASIWNSPQQ
jgi:fructan beta-fructosidase